MEAILTPSSANQSFSFREAKNPTKKKTPRFISRKTENVVATSNFFHGNHLFSHQHSIFQSHQPNQRQDPPLLPLSNSNPTRKSNRRSRETQSLTPRKSKKLTKRPEEPNPHPKEISQGAESFIIASIMPLGPHPNDLPKSVFSRVNVNDNSERFSGSVFTVSPPPSSLPLPNFSVRPRLSCSAEASGIDARATDNLRRLLRLL